MQKPNRTLLWIFRAVFFCIGFVAGFFIIREIISGNQNVDVGKYKYAYCAGSGVLFGVILMLSTTSFIRLGGVIADGLKGLFRGTDRITLAGALSGIVSGILLTVLFDFLLSLGLEIFSLRIVLDVAFALIAVTFSGYMLVKLMRTQVAPKKQPQKAKAAPGYVFSASALRVKGVKEFCAKWLSGSITVLDCSVAKLLGGGEECEQALCNYRELLNEGAISTAPAETSDEAEELRAFARKSGARIVVADGNEIDGEDLTVLSLSELLYGDNTVKPIDET